MINEIDEFSFEQGWRQGWKEGYDSAQQEYQPSIEKFCVELITLNARISYLERTIGGTRDTTGTD